MPKCSNEPFADYFIRFLQGLFDGRVIYSYSMTKPCDASNPTSTFLEIRVAIFTSGAPSVGWQEEL